MNDQTDTVEADRALKQKHRAMWASGDYPALADEILLELGAVLVEASGITSRHRVLDVAAGSGNAAIPAAMMGARVVASDLTPELFEAGRREAANRGVSLDWQEADAEALPYGDGEFDTVMSCLGVMFAPHHQAAADELVRVCKPGGTIGLLSWTPEGFIGQMFATMKPFAPPPPPGAQPAPLWGSEDHVRELLGNRITDAKARKQTLAVRSFHQPGDFVRYFKSHYGPTISVYKFIGEDKDKARELDEALTKLADSFGDAHGDTPFQMEWEYLLFTARKAQ
ncbi:class I SAM-dependent methyltransferase [Pseudarthrobacter sp. NamE2]|uniref:class I SAM-dependent methyltransferase n=1 Tax=Pseudarthrobacter sp. NamE2 TaxID=2576838 RepID=UPI0010FED26F|nr:class I SAM-dependent methyltransferase [Pseudarthrobacter sp. NamE2]TLM82887.1 class I SAM-dependent methyltransferase [Pseudarthrobacter sp. NamE2]